MKRKCPQHETEAIQMAYKSPLKVKLENNIVQAAQEECLFPFLNFLHVTQFMFCNQ